eukprot:TRINITY_DN81769_c0_g1_i1.p1 TRINITY_DN81769_c0_g1~~TRINITY_DN81769_c0_g1_i1.p1  ORF type:complete len:327 (-),score=35.14 TRINITY_DN81769_c0_g1_i1:147-1127(-)
MVRLRPAPLVDEDDECGMRVKNTFLEFSSQGTPHHTPGLNTAPASYQGSIQISLSLATQSPSSPPSKERAPFDVQALTPSTAAPTPMCSPGSRSSAQISPNPALGSSPAAMLQQALSTAPPLPRGPLSTSPPAAQAYVSPPPSWAAFSPPARPPRVPAGPVLSSSPGPTWLQVSGSSATPPPPARPPRTPVSMQASKALGQDACDTPSSSAHSSTSSAASGRDCERTRWADIVDDEATQDEEPRRPPPPQQSPKLPPGVFCVNQQTRSQLPIFACVSNAPEPKFAPPSLPAPLSAGASIPAPPSQAPRFPPPVLAATGYSVRWGWN